MHGSPVQLPYNHGWKADGKINGGENADDPADNSDK